MRKFLYHCNYHANNCCKKTSRFSSIKTSLDEFNVHTLPNEFYKLRNRLPMKILVPRIYTSKIEFPYNYHVKTEKEIEGFPLITAG